MARAKKNKGWEFLPVMYQTERLTLRDWQARDLEPFAALNSNETVMEFMPGILSRVESDELVDRIKNSMSENGFGLWALERREDARFIGYAGLLPASFQAYFTPCVEVGWRLDQEFWGYGYATEAAMKALDIGFNKYGLKEIVSFTVPDNVPSRRVMERLGMKHNPKDDFHHPAYAPGHPLSRHVLYRITLEDWKAKHNA